MTYHSNRANQLAKKEREWWDEIAKIHNLDLYECKYELLHKHGVIVVSAEED
jgi:hypothetical protein